MRHHVPHTRLFWRRPIAALAAVLAAQGCVAPGRPAPAEAAPIRTDHVRYQAGPAPGTGEPMVTVVATFQNRTSGVVHLAECQDRPPRYWLERLEGEGWVRAYDPPCWLRAVERLPTLPPGGTRTDTLAIRHFAGGQPSFRGGRLAGTYRLVYEVYSSYDPSRSPGATPVPPELARSNEFEIVP